MTFLVSGGCSVIYIIKLAGKLWKEQTDKWKQEEKIEKKERVCVRAILISVLSGFYLKQQIQQTKTSKYKTTACLPSIHPSFTLGYIFNEQGKTTHACVHKTHGFVKLS